MEKIAGVKNKVGFELDYLVNGRREGIAYILFPLVESGG